MKAIVITHKETEFYFTSWELELKWMLFFVIFMWTVGLWSGLVTFRICCWTAGDSCWLY